MFLIIRDPNYEFKNILILLQLNGEIKFKSVKLNL